MIGYGSVAFGGVVATTHPSHEVVDVQRTVSRSVMGMEAGLRINSSLVIPDGELTWRATRSGGPGGQHANTSDTRVEVTFDAAGSDVLGPRQREKIVSRWGETVRASAADTRSQAQNRERAAARLADKLRDALRTKKKRHPTRPTRASRRRRVDAKKRRSDTKRQRRRPTVDD